MVIKDKRMLKAILEVTRSESFSYLSVKAIAVTAVGRAERRMMTLAVKPEILKSKTANIPNPRPRLNLKQDAMSGNLQELIFIIDT